VWTYHSGGVALLLGTADNAAAAVDGSIPVSLTSSLLLPRISVLLDNLLESPPHCPYLSALLSTPLLP